MSSPAFVPLCNSEIALGINIDICKHAAKANLMHEFFYVDAVLQHPKSKGQIIINSVDPYADPVIKNNHLSETEDLTTLRNALRFYAGLTKTTFQKREFRY